MAEVDIVFDIVARIVGSIESLHGVKWLSDEVKDELERIQRTLIEIYDILFSVRQQRFTSYSMGSWLLNLKFVIIDVDDVIDLILTQDLELKVNGTTLFWRFTRQFTIGNVTRELKEIRRRLDEAFQQPRGNPRVVGQRESFNVCASNVIGREEDKERIIGCLKKGCSELGVKHLFTIPIFGISGIGKTALAKLVYDDPDIVASFELRLWVNVSVAFDVRSLMIDILHQSGCDKNLSLMDFPLLGWTFTDTLRGRTFLLVLDDVWFEETSAEWVDLQHLLAKCGAPTSRIIVTTREKLVADITGTTKEYNLKGLSEEDCWCVFASYAFTEGEEKAYPDLAQIGKSIIRKCHGVPLVATTLGRLLRNERDYQAWKRIEESELSKIGQGHNDILSALKLSYNRIPYYIRSCFAQCAMYKKGQPLFRTDVINVWMALGFLHSGRMYQDIESTAEWYIDVLQSRSVFQSPGYDVANKVITGFGKVFDETSLWADLVQMFESEWRNNPELVCDTYFQEVRDLFFVEVHDLVHDLATYLSEKEIAIITTQREAIPPGAMHILWNTEDLSSVHWGFSEVRKARSFAFVHPGRYLSKSFLHGLISSLTCLRILDLSFSEFEELPESVGDLKHLRYLKLCWNSKLIGLPDSTSKLVNLQSLDLFHCIELDKLPKDIHKLASLRFLSLTSKLESFHEGLFGLTCLRVLRLAFCENLISLPRGIGNLKKLRHLEIICCRSLGSLPNEIRELTSLERLSIFCCEKLDLMGWEGLYGLKNLDYLDLNELPRLEVFPRGLLAATSLQQLRVQKCKRLRELGEGLNRCKFLSQLTLSGCPLLTQLPRSVRNLKCLHQLNIDGCPEIARTCVKGGTDWGLISHICQIIINRQVIKK